MSDEQTRKSAILRAVMATGAGMLITGMAGMLLCPIQIPLNFYTCIQVTGRIFDVLVRAGMFPQVAGVLGGISFFWISGNWHKN